MARSLLASVTPRFSFSLIACCATVLLAAGASTVLAQSSPGPLLTPFEKDKDLELTATATMFGQSHIKSLDDDFQLRQYESEGRYRFTDKYDANPALGYSFLFLDLDTPNDAVPLGNLTDVSVGFATPIKKWDNGWYIAAGLGVGYAGEQLFDNSDAFYGKATFIVGKKIDDTSSLLVALSYDGSRTLYPDVPLPAFAYTKLIDPKLELALGFPYTTVTYRPVEELKLQLTALIGTISASAQYDLTHHIQFYTSFDAISRGFTIDDLSRDDRLFFDQKRAELGVIWKPGAYVGITLAGGYAFAQEFSTGFDERETDLIYKPGDVAYARIGLVWRP